MGRSNWYINRRPPRFAFFVSHVSEDNADVIRLKAEIHALSSRGGAGGLTCFLDDHDWPPGGKSLQVIRDAMLESEHFVLWVSPNYLKTTRGWVWLELAYAELIEASLESELTRDPRRNVVPFIAPIMRGVKVDKVSRPPLHDYWQRNVIPHGPPPTIEAVAAKLVEFYRYYHHGP